MQKLGKCRSISKSKQAGGQANNIGTCGGEVESNNASLELSRTEWASRPAGRHIGQQAAEQAAKLAQAAIGEARLFHMVKLASIFSGWLQVVSVHSMFWLFQLFSPDYDSREKEETNRKHWQELNVVNFHELLRI